MNNYITIYTDGGSRGNPGPAAYGAVIYCGDTRIAAFGKSLGITTNNVAEYSGILESLVWVDSNRESIGEFSGINFYMDSQLACQQLKGLYRVKKPHLAVFLMKIHTLERKIGKPVTYTHIPREKNKEADFQVNQALDNIT